MLEALLIILLPAVDVRFLPVLCLILTNSPARCATAKEIEKSTTFIKCHLMGKEEETTTAVSQ